MVVVVVVTDGDGGGDDDDDGDDVDDGDDSGRVWKEKRGRADGKNGEETEKEKCIVFSKNNIGQIKKKPDQRPQRSAR